MSRPRRPWLPDLLLRMSEAHGLETALRFARVYGGQYLTMPAKASAAHPVAREFGLPLLEWLISQRERRERLVVPRAAAATIDAQKQAVADLLEQGHSTNEIAALLGLHVRTVERRRQAIAAGLPSRQTDFLALI